MPSDFAAATLSQYFASRLSFSEMAFFDASSRRLYEAFDSSRFAPIELPARNNCVASWRDGPGMRAKSSQKSNNLHVNRNARARKSSGTRSDTLPTAFNNRANSFNNCHLSLPSSHDRLIRNVS